MENKLIIKYQLRAYLFAALFLCFVAIGVWGYLSPDKKYSQEEAKVSETKKEEPIIKKENIISEIKESASLVVPYTVQAPFANWAIHEESCEEATLLMYRQFLLGDSSADLDPYWVDKEIRAMKSWQVKNYGVEPDLSIEKLGKFANDYYGYNPRVIKNGTAEDLKREISADRPVLVPVMTHSLQNPHYGRQDTYHILLAKGYGATGVIANDSGIKEGKSYVYSWDVLFSAIDAQKSKMDQGRDFLVLVKN